jgi:hypothetical protein
MRNHSLQKIKLLRTSHPRSMLKVMHPLSFLYPFLFLMTSHAPYTSAATENSISPAHTPELLNLTPTSSSLPTIDPIPIQPEPTSDPNPDPPSPPPTHHMITRTRTNSLRPKEFPDFQLYHTSTPNLESEIEPVSYKKAATDPRWRHAM